MSATRHRYAERQGLFAELEAQDQKLDWAGVFALAEQHDAQRLQQAASVRPDERPTARKTVLSFGRRIWSSAVFVAVAGFGVRITGRWEHQAGHARSLAAWLQLLLAQSSEFVFRVVFFACLGWGALFAVAGMVALLTMSMRQRAWARRSSMLERTGLTVPSPVSYQVLTELGEDGEVIAHISRCRPQVEDGWLKTSKEACGQVVLGTDEGGAEFAERFAQLRSELGDLEHAALATYRSLLFEHGLDEEHLELTAASLRASAQDAHERKTLNAGVIAALNRA